MKNLLEPKMANEVPDTTIITTVVAAAIGAVTWFVRKVFLIDKEYVSREELAAEMRETTKRIEKAHEQTQARIDKIYQHLIGGKPDE